MRTTHNYFSPCHRPLLSILFWLSASPESPIVLQLLASPVSTDCIPVLPGSYLVHHYQYCPLATTHTRICTQIYAHQLRWQIFLTYSFFFPRSFYSYKSNPFLHLHIKPCKFYHIIFRGKAACHRKAVFPLPRRMAKPKAYIPKEGESVKAITDCQVGPLSRVRTGSHGPQLQPYHRPVLASRVSAVHSSPALCPALHRWFPGYWEDNELKGHCSWVPGSLMGRCTSRWALASWDFSDLNAVISHVIWHSVSQTSEPPEGRIKSQINEACIKRALDWSVHVAFETALLPAQNALSLSTLGCSSWNLQTSCLTSRSVCLPPRVP